MALLEATGHWVPDSSRFACVCCSSKFSVLRRKHHCRVCGEVVCSACLQSREVKNHKRPQMVCLTCRTLHDSAASGRLSGTDRQKMSKKYKVLVDGYLHIAAGHKQDTKWKRRYFQLRDNSNYVLRGSAMLGFESSTEAQKVVPPLVVVGIRKATIVRCSINCYARVKDAFHFQIIQRNPDQSNSVSHRRDSAPKPRRSTGTDKHVEEYSTFENATVFEASTAEMREKWIEAFVAAGAVLQDQDLKAQRISERSVKEGFLCKIGKKEKTAGTFGGWRVRYFILDFNPCRLEYFLSFNEALQNKPKNVLLLAQETIIAGLEGEYLGMKHTIGITPKGGRRYLLSCRDEAEKVEWMKLLDEVRLTQNQYMAKPSSKQAFLTTTLDTEDYSVIDEEEIQRRIAELTPEQQEQIATARKKIEAERAERQKQFDVLEQQCQQEHEKMNEAQTKFLQAAKRVQILMRVAKKDTAELNQQRATLDSLVDDIVADGPLLREIETLMEEDKKKCETKEKDLEERGVDLVELREEVERLEKERKRLDGLLVQFADVLQC